MLQVNFGEVQFKAPETSQYLSIAIQLLETHKGEMGGSSTVGQSNGSSPLLLPQEATPLPTLSQEVKPSAQLSHKAGPSQVLPQKKVRWFVSHWPRIALPDGGFAKPKSLEELKGFIQGKGLTSHPRGDASMLVWQVRNRLKLQVEAEV